MIALVLMSFGFVSYNKDGVFLFRD